MNMVVTIDYTPLMRRPDLCGVLFVSEYLRWINYENVFCQKFANKKICFLLRRVYLNYEEMPINICEIVLIYIVILEFLGKIYFNLMKMTFMLVCYIKDIIAIRRHFMIY